MYEEFYGLKSRCFSKTPDPSFLYMSRGHAEALARLQYAVEERDFALLTGGIGSGKTTLSRALVDSLDETYRPLLIINPRLSPAQFLRTLAVRLGVERPRHFKADLLEQINGALYRLHEQGICPVAIVDEAQLIPGKDTFEEIRLLTNYQLDDTNLLALVVIGQPELRSRLKRPAYDALRQRIGVSFHLEPFGAEDTARYVSHRLGVAGGDGGLFAPDAVEALHRYSGGIPRVINNLATGALLSGMGAGAPVIARAMVEDAARELGLDG